MQMRPVRANKVYARAVSYSIVLLEVLNKVINILKFKCIIYIGFYSLILSQSIYFYYYKLFLYKGITTRTPPNYYTYTPYLIWFRRFLIKLDISSLS